MCPPQSREEDFGHNKRQRRLELFRVQSHATDQPEDYLHHALRFRTGTDKVNVIAALFQV